MVDGVIAKIESVIARSGTSRGATEVCFFLREQDEIAGQTNYLRGNEAGYSATDADQVFSNMTQPLISAIFDLSVTLPPVRNDARKCSPRP